MRDFERRLEVGHIEFRVADCLRRKSRGSSGDRLAERLQILESTNSPCVQLGKRVVEKLVCAAVKIVRRNDFVADLRDARKRVAVARLSRRDRERAGCPPSMGRRMRLLKNVRGRFMDAGVCKMFCRIPSAQKRKGPRARCLLNTKRGGLVKISETAP